MKIKVSEATPSQLDWLVAKAQGWVTYPTDSKEQGQWYHTNAAIAPMGYEHNRVHIRDFKPSTDWAQGGPIIEDEVITISDCECGWVAGYTGTLNSFGPTPLIAAMRCYASKLGSEVEVPESLIES